MKNFVYKLSDGKIIHPECRLPYLESKPKGSNFAAIQSVIHQDKETGEQPPTSFFKEGRFTLCAHCMQPIFPL